MRYDADSLFWYMSEVQGDALDPLGEGVEPDDLPSNEYYQAFYQALAEREQQEETLAGVSPDVVAGALNIMSDEGFREESDALMSYLDYQYGMSVRR